MKKTYMKPEMGVEVIELESMIATSGDADLKYTSDETAVVGRGMDGKDRNDSDWGGLW